METMTNSGVGIKIAASEDYISTRCSCGSASLTPIKYALDRGGFSCQKCGAGVTLDQALVDNLSKQAKQRQQQEESMRTLRSKAGAS
jgi:hypothetical protein